MLQLQPASLCFNPRRTYGEGHGSCFVCVHVFVSVCVSVTMLAATYLDYLYVEIKVPRPQAFERGRRKPNLNPSLSSPSQRPGDEATLAAAAYFRFATIIIVQCAEDFEQVCFIISF